MSFEQRILSFVLVTLRPPADATPGRIRRAGALTAVLGLASLAATVAVMALLESKAGLEAETVISYTSPLWLLGFGGLVIGLFRLLLAREPESMGLAARVALGVTLGFGSLLLLVVGFFTLSILASLMMQPGPR